MTDAELAKEVWTGLLYPPLCGKHVIGIYTCSRLKDHDGPCFATLLNAQRYR